MRDNSRMAQTTQWLQAIRNCMKKVMLNISTVCMASFLAQTAKISSNDVMIIATSGVWFHYTPV